jgi:exosortase
VALGASADLNEAAVNGDSAAIDPGRVRQRPVASLEATAVLLGLAALVLPTLLSLAQEHWSTDNGAHGPIILVTGAWLFWRERGDLRLRPGSIGTAWLAGLLPPLLALYVYSRIFGVLFLETSSLYCTLVLLGFYYLGPQAMGRLWFAVLYMGFLIKPPSSLVAELTQPLKLWISESAVSMLHSFGYPIGNSGVAIQIAQYELLVQQACAGLGSIFTLLAIGLLYLHLTKTAGSFRNIVLIASLVPIAVFANLARVIVLILLTYHAGNGVAQSFAHDIAGLATFMFAVLGMLAVDALIHSVAARRSHD